jgi:creatinine amidohydrolase
MYLHDLKWPEVAALSRDTLIVLPTASLVQHGRHLPLGSASHLVTEIMRRAEKRLTEKLLILPVLWLGDTQAHEGFAGTLGASPKLYSALLLELLEQLITQGFKRILLLNASAGNDSTARQAIAAVKKTYGTRQDFLLIHCNYADFEVRPWEVVQNIGPKTESGHACEWQSSMMMRLAPGLVGEVAALREVELRPRLGPTAQVLLVREHSEDGHVGNPSLANEVKGEVLLQGYTAELVVLLEQLLSWGKDAREAH